MELPSSTQSVLERPGRGPYSALESVTHTDLLVVVRILLGPLLGELFTVFKKMRSDSNEK